MYLVNVVLISECWSNGCSKTQVSLGFLYSYNSNFKLMVVGKTEKNCAAAKM